MSDKKRKIALCGGLCGLIYLIQLFIPLPDFISGFVLGLALSLLILALLPEEVLVKLKKLKGKLKPSKRYGE